MPKTENPLTDREKEAIHGLSAEGWSIKRIAEQFGRGWATIKYVLDPKYEQEHRKRLAQYRRQRYLEDNPHPGRRYTKDHAEVRVPPEDEAARLAEIPADDRTPVQKLLGDPIFERSALARKLGVSA